MDLKTLIRTIPDFPEEGVLFRDITPVLQDSEGLKAAINQMQDCFKDIDFDLIVGPESRGFFWSSSSL